MDIYDLIIDIAIHYYNEGLIESVERGIEIVCRKLGYRE